MSAIDLPTMRVALRLGANVYTADFGKEKVISLKGLDDKGIEQQVSELVKSSI